MNSHGHTWHRPLERHSRTDLARFLTEVFPGYSSVGFVHHQCISTHSDKPCGAINVFSYSRMRDNNRRISYSGNCYNCRGEISETFNNADFQKLGWPFANTQYGTPFRVMRVIKELEAEGALNRTNFKMVSPVGDFQDHRLVNIEEFTYAFYNAKNVSTQLQLTQEE